MDINDVKACPAGTFRVDGECRQVPYEDEVVFYADHKGKTIVTSRIAFAGKGWYDVRVGKHTKKVRVGDKPKFWREKLLESHYPGHDDKLSLFSEMSYHSSLTRGEAGKVTSYGTEDYTKDFSAYKKIAQYKLLQPVKTQSKREFGKIKDKVMLHKWRYIAINWVPQKRGDVTLFVEDKIKDPITGRDETLFISKQMPLSQKKKAFELFDKRVAIAKKW